MSKGLPNPLLPERTPSKELIDSLCTQEFIRSINETVAAHRAENKSGGMNLDAVITDLISAEPFFQLVHTEGTAVNSIERQQQLSLAARIAFQIAARLREKKLDGETSFNGQLFDIPARVELLQKVMVSSDPTQPNTTAPRYVARFHPGDTGASYAKLSDGKEIIAAQINFAVPRNPNDATQGYKAGFQLKLAVPDNVLQMTVQSGQNAHADPELCPLIPIIVMAQFSEAFEKHTGAGVMRRRGESRVQLKELLQSLPPLPKLPE